MPTVTPPEDNVTPEVQEDIEPTPPQEDNGDPETPEVDAEKEAMKLKIADQAQKLRASKEEGLRLKDKIETPTVEPEADSAISEADLAMLRAANKKLGYVTQDELKRRDEQAYKKEETAAMSRFYKKHPEYSPENDTDDTKFTSLKETLKDYNLSSDPSQWDRVLDKAHKDLNPEDTSVILEKGKAQGNAEVNLARQAQIGGGGSGAVSTPKKKQTPEQKANDEEFKQQYPEYFEE